MRRAWTEFKNFAMGGNMIDLALGFIMATAFAKLVESLAGNIMMQLVAAIFGKPDFSGMVLNVNGAHIRYGAFVTDLVNFFLLALVMFAFVQLIRRAGLGNFKAQGQRECQYCKEFVAIDAIRCKHCHMDIDPVVLDEDDIPLLEQRPGWVRPPATSGSRRTGSHEMP